MSYFYISAAHKSSGKTTLSVGLCAALRATNLSVQAFKKGPDYIDPLWLANASGRSCYNLDFYTMGQQELEQLFYSKLYGADIGVIEGNKGLYDGVSLDGSDSNAMMAISLNAPVVLVLDSQGVTRGVAPLIQGYQQFDSRIDIRGVILNKVGGPRHESKLRAVIEQYTDVKVLGAVAKAPELAIDERHLGLVPSNEAEASVKQIQRMGKIVAEQVDLDSLIELGRPFDKYQGEPISVDVEHQSEKEIVIAYAEDAAFGFYYADDLDALRAHGCKLIPFSPLCDTALPTCDGLFIGGGFPETHLDKLSANTAMHDSIKEAIDEGLPTYAECGGLMYLSRSLTWKQNTGKMAAIIPADVVMHDKPQGRGYVKLRETAAHPWQEGDESSTVISAHEFHYSGLETLPEDTTFAYEVERGFGIDGHHDGICYRNLLANYAHLRTTDNNQWALRFVDFVKRCINHTDSR